MRNERRSEARAARNGRGAAEAKKQDVQGLGLGAHCAMVTDELRAAELLGVPCTSFTSM